MLVDVPLTHLDRPFDYLVSAELDARVVVGCRVRVRFAGRLVDAYVIGRAAASDHEGRLSFLERVVTSEPLVSAELLDLAGAVADRWAGTTMDVLRLAVPPRHAATEAKASPVVPAAVDLPGRVSGRPSEWAPYPAGPALLRALSDGGHPRVTWWVAPGTSWPCAVSEAIAATLAGDRGAVVVLPDARDAQQLSAELAAAGIDHELLAHDLGPAERYRRWLRVHRGECRVAIGPRAAVYAPVRDLGLLVVWDDGDDVLAEPRSPYAHPRDVAALRSHLTGAGLIVGGWSPSVEAWDLTATGWCKVMVADQARVRASAPRIEAAADDLALSRDAAARSARLPGKAVEAARAALAEGAPVLVQVPRRGYVPALSCQRCRRPARCLACQGPLAAMRAPAQRGSAEDNEGWAPASACSVCGVPASGWQCSECSSRRLRAAVVGTRRTAEELGRAFPGVPVLTSGREGVLDVVPTGAALVVSTPGAEPRADGGYGAVLLLDAWALLGRWGLRAAEEALRRWLNAAALARPASAGGRVVVTADAGLPVVQALVRWSPITFIEREAAERSALGFPPATRLASVHGTTEAVRELLTDLELPGGAAVLGPLDAPTVDGEARQRFVVRAPRAAGTELAHALKAALGRRSAHRAEGVARVQLDPAEPV